MSRLGGKSCLLSGLFFQFHLPQMLTRSPSSTESALMATFQDSDTSSAQDLSTFSQAIKTLLGDGSLVARLLSDSLRPQGLQLSRLLCPWDFPGKNTGMGCCSRLWDLPDPGNKPASPTLKADSLPLSHQGVTRTLLRKHLSENECHHWFNHTSLTTMRTLLV